jgi:hypothetical protein
VLINFALSQLAHALDRRLGRRRVTGGTPDGGARPATAAGDRVAPVGQLS